ncbi:MAG: hypothetical protein OEU50_23950, partial [Gammaproteobacteria bacterium]|nr:hypothetical protein [Gammaproteobacteria bacterium]
LFREVIGSLERRYGYDFHRDNPKRLIRRLAQSCVILHDEFDRLVPIEQSRAAAEENSLISLQPTRNLGHTRILKSDSAIAAVNGYLLEQLPEAS